MKIAVIGGSGFIGTRLIARLLNSGHSVTILDKEKSAFFPDLWTNADVRNPESLEKGLEGIDVIVNLAAEHKDNVTPRSLYDEVNVDGAVNICTAAEKYGIKKIIFTSSVAIYGFAPPDTDENGTPNPFNDYGRTKLLAEGVFKDWYSRGEERSLTIIRPTVVFGERNRGNVYNLLKQMASGRFIMVGNGKNKKSMAYVENVAAFIECSIGQTLGVFISNYVDKPDFDMNHLVALVQKLLQNSKNIRKIPYFLGYAGGLVFDVLSVVTGRKFPVSSIRVKKFCSTTQFKRAAAVLPDFHPPVDLEEGLKKTIEFEFLETKSEDEIVFYSE